MRKRTLAALLNPTAPASPLQQLAIKAENSLAPEELREFIYSKCIVDANVLLGGALIRTNAEGYIADCYCNHETPLNPIWFW